MTECSISVEFTIGNEVCAVAFSGNEYLVSGDRDGVQVWQGRQALAAMQTKYVQCVAVSKDGRWIAAGTRMGDVLVLDAETHAQVLKHQEDTRFIYAVDFSPDTSRLVHGSANGTAIVWDLGTRKRIQTLRHDYSVFAAKYSPLGDRIASATNAHVRVWDSNDGRLLVDVPVTVVPYRNNGLAWNNKHLFVISIGVIRKLDASTGSIVSQWPVEETNEYSCIALPKHEAFVAYTTNYIVTFWDSATDSKIGRIQHPQDIRSIAISPDDRSIAIGGLWGRVRIERLPIVPARQEEHWIVDDALRVPDRITHSTFREPEFQIDNTVIDAWEQDQFEIAEAALTTAIAASLDPTHEILVSRALIRTRLREWAASLADAEMAIEARPSAIGFIVKSVAHVGNGERYKAYHACDIAFGYLDSSYVPFLLLVKAIIVFMAGEHVDALSRVDRLIAVVPSESECRVVQAYMHLLVGKSCMDGSNYQGAIESFQHARAKLRPLPPRSLFLVSLISGWKFDPLEFATRQCLCEALSLADRITDAIEALRLMNDLGEEMSSRDGREWAMDFRQRCSTKMMHLGDAAVSAKRYGEAVDQYSTALSLEPPSPQDVYVKRSKAYLETGSWKQASDDANQAIAHDPSSPWGYKAKHAALHKGGDYENAIAAFEEMLSKLEHSPDQEVQRLSGAYVRTSSTRATICKVALRTTARLPPELINTTDGRMYNRADLELTFQSSRICHELVSAMTTRIDYVRIKHEVRQYFRYVMLSHKWEPGEPLFQDVVHTSVYSIEPSSPTRHKLQSFCQLVRDHGFIWAWSDTCCINKSDNFVLQEALVAMFKWYEGSALTIVYLRGVSSSAQFGALMRSIWNTRAWTLQEYVAAKIVLFYTEDWTLYLNLQLQNHKESRDVIREMEEATGVSAEELVTLRPGLGGIREKLRLASTRKTTLVEDEAYSLLGIFSASGIPAIYGEREGALGRLLANVITRSGDVGILAWTGDSGPFNSCLPARVSVYNGPETSHLPTHLPDTEMDKIMTASHASPFDLDIALRLYDCLRNLPTPRFAESRMTTPCMTFRLPRLSLSGMIGVIRVYHTRTDPFGGVEIRTKYDLTKFGTLYLVHPWLGSLLEHDDTHFGEDHVIPPPSPHVDDDEMDDITVDEEVGNMGFGDTMPPPSPQSPTLPSPVLMVIDRETRARRLVARLRQPFGALVFRLTAAGQRIQGYKRVAADSVIQVRFREEFALANVLERVRTVDVL